MSDQTVSMAAAKLERGIELSASGSALPNDTVTVKATGRSAYTYCARAASRFRRFITVKAIAFAAVIESRVRAFLINVFPKTGADILRQSAILMS